MRLERGLISLDFLNHFISKRLPFLIFFVGISTYFSPYHWKVYTWVPSVLLGVVIFFTGLSMDLSSIKNIHKKKKELFIASFLKWTVTVFISIGLAMLFFSNQPDIAAGMILSGVVPSATAATLYTFLASGNTSLVVSASLLDVFISPIVTPLSMLGISNLQIQISFFSLLKSFFIIVFVPLSIGLVFQRYLPTLVTYSKSVTRLGSSLTLLLIIHMLVGNSREAISSEIKVIPLLAVVTFFQVLIPMILSYVIALKLSLTKEDARAILFHVGLCNTALAAILAFEFIGPLASIAPIVNMIFNLSLGALFANYFARKNSSSLEMKGDMRAVNKIIKGIN
ncbi:bile acid:sodium symporter [Bacillus sp. 31A1R]|uniref:Bile acid:sodium symporter n=1 Tax=Robertmurraya mangrovi TaxID=3098077 RepID=A0ABU5IW04_9BACI|nr:bile acid:sodium symporter [Bacillus sp. 31A1R]MDZ5471348.1 bile acid:sodium symporter [Bacillus sp. 31A1R]